MWPALFIPQLQQQHVYVIWHDYCCVKVVAFAVVMQAVLEDGISGFWGECDLIGLAECDE